MKTISLPYEEYLADIQKAENEIYETLIRPIRALVEVEISSGVTHDGGPPPAHWKFQGTAEELLNAICKILKEPTLAETRKALKERYRG